MVEIKNFEPRLYQETILNTCTSKNCLIILPTGLGKTKTAILAAVQRLNSYPKSKVLFLTVTKPLAEQIYDEFKESVDIDEGLIRLFTGHVKPEERGKLWKESKVIVSTPQCIENDLINGRISIKDVSLLINDEAHNAVKDYAYTWINKQYYKKSKYPRIIGLTASPGSDLSKIKEVCDNLYIEDIEVRTEQDPDVKPYVHEKEIEWVKVKLPKPFIEIKKYLDGFLKEKMKMLKKWGVLKRKERNFKYVSKKDLLKLQGQIRGQISAGEKNFVLWKAISVLAEIMKMHHALELLETQGISALHKYLKKLREESKSTKTKAIKNIVKDENYKSALIKAEKLFNEGVQHPKLVELQKVIEKELKKNKDTKMIVFNQYRDSASEIVKVLNEMDGVEAQLFVGQLKKGETGLSQKEQKELLKRFKEEEFNVLVATSIGEQGLDIAAVNLVIFYEPVPSAIRQIQRMGRTGRHDKGKIVVLMAEDTRDVGYRWAAHHKEKKMHKHLKNIKEKINLENNSVQNTLNEYKEKLNVFADHREKGSKVIKELVDKGFNVKLEKLDAADYLLSSRCAVEFKTVSDFVDSIVDGRLLEQIKVLKDNYERPLVVIEGSEDIFSMRNVHPNSILGMLATIGISYGIPILQTKDYKETASLLSIIARREQEETSKEFSMHGSKKPLTLKEQQEYIISSLPGVGTTLAKPLLKKFGSVKKIMNAKKEELEEVEKIGKKKAGKIREVVDEEYED